MASSSNHQIRSISFPLRSDCRVPCRHCPGNPFNQSGDSLSICSLDLFLCAPIRVTIFDLDHGLRILHRLPFSISIFLPDCPMMGRLPLWSGKPLQDHDDRLLLRYTISDQMSSMGAEWFGTSIADVVLSFPGSSGRKVLWYICQRFSTEKSLKKKKSFVPLCEQRASSLKA